MYAEPMSGYQVAQPSAAYGGGEGMALLGAVVIGGIAVAAALSSWVGWKVATWAGAGTGWATAAAVVSAFTPWAVSWVRTWLERRKARSFWASPEGQAMRQQNIDRINQQIASRRTGPGIDPRAVR